MDDPVILPEFQLETFFREHWRKRPVLVKGGAEDFLGRRYAEPDFVRALAAARASRGEGGASVKEREGDVIFIENVSAVDDDLAGRMARVGRSLGTPQPWCDTIRTFRQSGIGSHYDHSDNFVLHQEGVKDWSLAPSTHIPREDYARRMLGFPGIGSAEMPEDCVRFTLEPGDLMYIPLMWLHSGVSRGESLSLSVVCPVVTLYSAVLPVASRLLRDRGVGHQALEAVPQWLPAAEREAAAERVDRASRVLLSHLTKDATWEAVRERQHQLFPGLRPDEVTPAGTGEDRTS
jgi:50S ribosomal protein L16 3-hydroxylase